MDPNGSKLLQIFPNDYGLGKWLWQWSNMVPNGLKCSKNVPNYPQLSNIVQNGQIWYQNVGIGPKGEKMVTKSPHKC